jgi:prepilin-type N-terminal cleavage/methylation domain-containing protein
MFLRTNDSQGFSLLEVMSVAAVLGIVVALAFPSMNRFLDKQEAKSSATKIAGVLDEARSHAITEATPHLVYINPISADASGACGPAAVIVRDSDRSYSITDGDRQREVHLDPSACKKVDLFGEGESTEEAAAVAEIPLPEEDHTSRGLGLGRLLGGVTEGVTELVEDLLDPNGAGAPVAPRNDRVADTVVNGATFPVDVASGRPVIAFSERGIPVDPTQPTNWGSGAGAVYLTDRHATVYAAVVQPMGSVKVRVFDRGANAWR